MEINPHDLGPKVYKEEQVVTLEDLQIFIDDLKGFMFSNEIDKESEVKALTTIHVFEVLTEWIGNNKEQELGFFKEDEEGYDEYIN